MGHEFALLPCHGLSLGDLKVTHVLDSCFTDLVSAEKNRTRRSLKGTTYASLDSPSPQGPEQTAFPPVAFHFFIYLCLAYVSTIHCQKETPLPSSPTEGFWEEETSLPLAAM